MLRLGMLLIGAGAVAIWGGDLTAMQGYALCMIVSGVGFFVDPFYRKALLRKALFK